MNFTFGIVTDYSAPDRIAKIADSIRGLMIPKYEILLVSPLPDMEKDDLRNIYMYDPHHKGLVTKKKNIIAQQAQYDNLVIFHDYYEFDSQWYNGYLRFGDDWDVCSNAQLLITGKRHFTDWVVWDSPVFPRYTSLAYSDWSHTRYMYQSGGYMLIKREFLLRFPMNESMPWGTAEDVEWSLRMRDHANWK